MHKLQYEDAPRENLQTWSFVTKLLGYGAGLTAIFLLILRPGHELGPNRASRSRDDNIHR